MTARIIQFPRRHIYRTHDVCPEPGRCPICDGGLSVCTVCRNAEGSLPTHCPGYDCYLSHGEAIYAGYIDYINGEWRMITPPYKHPFERNIR